MEGSVIFYFLETLVLQSSIKEMMKTKII